MRIADSFASLVEGGGRLWYWVSLMETIPTSGFPETADIETSSEAYARRFAGAVGAWFLEIQARLTLAVLAGACPGKATVLDVGGGHGQLAGPLVRAGQAVTVLGSDPSCGQRVADLVATRQCRFEVGNVVALPYPDRAFDVALSFRLLPHCEAWPRLIAELCRVARVAVIVDYPIAGGINALAPALFGAKKTLEGNTRAWRAFRDAEIAAEFERHGFRRQRREPQFFLPMALHRAMRCRRLSALLETGCRGLGLTRRWGSPVIACWVRG